MTSAHPPVVSYPLPRLPVPIEPAPELLSLARQSPVLQTALPGNTTGWLVTGFQQVREVLADPRFSRALAARPGRELRGIELISATSLLGLDPPEHTRLRKLVAGTFTARRMQQLVPQIAAIVNELIDRMLAGPRPADLTEAFRGLLGRLPGLRLAVGVDQLRFKENMTITSLLELPVTWDS
jgi:cytochrome P450